MKLRLKCDMLVLNLKKTQEVKSDKKQERKPQEESYNGKVLSGRD